MSTNNNQQTGLKSSTREKIAKGFFIAAAFSAIYGAGAFFMYIINPDNLDLNPTKAFTMVGGLLSATSILTIIGICIKPEKPSQNITYQANSSEIQIV